MTVSFASFLTAIAALIYPSLCHSSDGGHVMDL
jgi:hypothetical protein